MTHHKLLPLLILTALVVFVAALALLLLKIIGHLLLIIAGILLTLYVWRSVKPTTYRRNPFS